MMGAKIVVTTLNCGHCNHCSTQTQTLRKELYCKLSDKRVMSYYPFCDVWTPKGIELNIISVDGLSEENLPVFVMLESRGVQ